MKRTIALATLIALSAPASASLFCKNDLGQSMEWKWGHARPNIAPAAFDVRLPRAVVCLVNGFALTHGIPQTGLQRVPVISDDSTAPGIVYRSRDAVWLIENLPALSGAPATVADYNAIAP